MFFLFTLNTPACCFVVCCCFQDDVSVIQQGLDTLHAYLHACSKAKLAGLEQLQLIVQQLEQDVQQSLQEMQQQEEQQQEEQQQQQVAGLPEEGGVEELLREGEQQQQQQQLLQAVNAAAASTQESSEVCLTCMLRGSLSEMVFALTMAFTAECKCAGQAELQMPAWLKIAAACIDSDTYLQELNIQPLVSWVNSTALLAIG
jgi:murein L,D-transpeptidase YcbB/YkuD